MLQYSKYSSEKDSSPYFFILFRGGIESPAANAIPTKPSGTTGHRTAESFIRQWSQAQELCGIRVGDIRFSNPASVLLHGKGGKSRVVPLMNRPQGFQQFIAERKFGTAEKDAPLFLNQRGEPITPACIRNVICKYISRAKNIRPDLFNESSQSSSFAGGWHRISLHSRLFRTCLVQTTEIYATVSQSMLNSVLRNRSIPKVLNVDLDELPPCDPGLFEKEKINIM